MAVAAGLVVLFASGVVAHNGEVGGVEAWVFHRVNDLPGALFPALWTIQQLGNLVAGPAVALVAAGFRKWRLALAALVLSFVDVEVLVKRAVVRQRPGATLEHVIRRGGDVPLHGQSFPSGHAVLAASLAMLVTPYLKGRWRAVPWVVLGLVCTGRVYVGAHNPLDVVAGAAIGIALGGVANLAVGVPVTGAIDPTDGAVVGAPAAPVAVGVQHSGRYRYPGDLARLIGSAALLVTGLAVALAAPERLYGARAGPVSGPDPGTSAFRLVVGLVQGVAVVAPLVVAAVVLRRRRFRLAASLLCAGGAAALLFVGIGHLIGGGTSALVAQHAHADSWLGTAGFPGPAHFAAAAATVVGVEPWLSRSWQRAAWALLLAAGALRLLVGVVVPLELVLALLTGTTVGLVLLVALGVPDRRLDAGGVADALAAAGLPVLTVAPAPVTAKGSRPFLAVGTDERRLFVKVLGAEQRTADLLYRTYRFVRFRGVGDVRPAGSLKQAVEHQALVGMMAERAGVRVPGVDLVVEADDGSALLVMEAVDGTTLAQVPPERVTDELLRRTWAEVDSLHHRGIAHRSLRTGNIMVDGSDRPWLVDFSFSEVGSTGRQQALDVAELLASLAVIVGPDRPVAAAATVLGPEAVGGAIPLLQPLALSAATRHELAGGDHLLDRLRASAVTVSGTPADEMAKVERVRPRTLLMIAVAAGAFYLLLPQLANARDSWQAMRSANWGWFALVIAMSLLTYVGAGVSMLGSVRHRLAFGPTVLTQMASSFVNRVSPANVGGMALNGRMLQKSGADSGTAVAGVALNSLAGGVMHVALIVIFFLWAGSSLASAFTLPSGSKVLLVIAVLGVVAGGLLLTRWGRRTLLVPLRRAVRSSVANLRDVARSPAKLALLFGGSAIVTLAYIAALVGSVNAFGGHLRIATVGAVYLGASVVASAAPTPGNLGALEAAMVAGLTGVGLEPATAVAAVLGYRLATYWLPILPGWLAWHIVQRRGYV